MIYRFDRHVLDVGAYELRRGEDVVPIQPKIFSLLEYLLQHADRAVSKQELLDQVWSDSVVGEAALAQAISQARRALGEGSDREIIQTVRGRGYRIVVPVQVGGAVLQSETPGPWADADASPVEPERHLAAILFTDIVGYTALMAESEERGLRVRMRHRAVVTPVVERHRGEMVEARGDECLALFSSALDAVRCALSLQDAVAGESDLNLHLGIHLGDVVRVGDEISGDGVNLASRICALSEGGGLCVSAEVWHAVRNHGEFEATLRAPQELKNVGRAVEVFAVERPAFGADVARGADGAASERGAQRLRTARARRAGVVAASMVAAGSVLVGWFGSSRLEPPTSKPTPVASRASPSSLAVLPFADMSPAGDQGHFADGLSEEILNALTRVKGLRVVARTSSFAFKGRGEDVRSIGAKLSVGRLVEGSVRRAGDRLRITAQLIDTANGFHLWSETYDRTVEDVFSVQEDIARAVVGAVRAEVVANDEPVGEGRPRDFGAYQLYLRGLSTLSHRSSEKIREATGLFEAAIAADPLYADAHAALAHAYILLWDYSSTERRDGELLARAEATAKRAIALDPRSAGAHASLGNVRAVRYLDWAGAESAYRRAIALNQGSTPVREQFASFLMQTARLDEARVQMLLALDANPLSPIVNRNVGRYYQYVGDNHRSLEFLWRSLELNPEEPIAPSLLFITYIQMGREDEALDAIVRLAPGLTRPFLRTTARLFGLRPAATVVLGVVRLADTCPMRANIAAQFYAYLDWPDAMYDCLDKAFESDLGYVAVNPLFDPFRNAPRFQEFISRAGLAAYTLIPD